MADDIFDAQSGADDAAETDATAITSARDGASARPELSGAIAKFENAHRNGPHFADPLEMWGEALIAKSRSDLALAKFEEAAKYAPNWGRLHLKWGEALYYAGKPDEARKQFAIAAKLDLTPSDKSELARMRLP